MLKAFFNFFKLLFLLLQTGYGHVVPKTEYGRIASILYAFIGIPLLLMVLTDLGKLFTRGIKFVFKYFRKLYNVRQIRRMRRATLAPTQVLSTLQLIFNFSDLTIFLSVRIADNGRRQSEDVHGGATARPPLQQRPRRWG